MRITEITKFMVRGIRLALALSVLVTATAFSQEVPAPPVIEDLGNGSYVVSYSACSQCLVDGIEEFQDATGTWGFVGSGPQTFTNRPPGTYHYRVVYAAIVGNLIAMQTYSPEAVIVVGEDSTITTPLTPPLTDQLGVEYTISSGDVDGDGRRDLMIRRAALPAETTDGTIGDVLLRQTSSAGLEASIPSPNALALAASWPQAGIELVPRDVNIDGYADLVLRNVRQADGFVGVENQILFAPGLSAGSVVPALRSVDASLGRFSGDMNRHLIDPEYYPTNAPLTYGVLYYISLECGWSGQTSLIEAWYSWNCYYMPQYTYFVYQDFSAFDQDAIEIASTDYKIIKGSESWETGLEHIAEVIARVLGVGIGGWDIEDLLGGTETESGEATRRGIELFAVLAGISEAVAQEPEDADEEEGPRDVSIPDRVRLKGRRVLGRGPFHTALEYGNSTVSAYDSDSSILFDGLLVSEVNWPPDHPNLTLRLGYVDGPTAPVIYWGSILAADARYDDDLPYDLFPSLGQGGYNSNSFVAGLILATLGRSTVEMSTFVGGERPVPASEFF